MTEAKLGSENWKWFLASKIAPNTDFTDSPSNLKLEAMLHDKCKDRDKHRLI